MTSDFFGPCPDPNSYRHFADPPPPYPGIEDDSPPPYTRKPECPSAVSPASVYEPTVFTIANSPFQQDSASLLPHSSTLLLQRNCGEPNHENPGGEDFSNIIVRRGFVTKVYTTLLVQLFITTAFIYGFTCDPKVKAFIRNSSILYGIIFAFWAFVVIPVTVTLGCSPTCRPKNFAFLFIFTLAKSFLLAAGASYLRTDLLLLIAGIISIACFSLIVYSHSFMGDFTLRGGTLYSTTLIFFCSAILCFFKNTYYEVAIASLAALLYSMYSIYEVQTMIRGKHVIFSISPDEYVFVALILYIAVGNILIYFFFFISKAVRNCVNKECDE